MSSRGKKFKHVSNKKSGRNQESRTLNEKKDREVERLKQESEISKAVAYVQDEQASSSTSRPNNNREYWRSRVSTALAGSKLGDWIPDAFKNSTKSTFIAPVTLDHPTLPVGVKAKIVKGKIALEFYDQPKQKEKKEDTSTSSNHTFTRQLASLGELTLANDFVPSDKSDDICWKSVSSASESEKIDLQNRLRQDTHISVAHKRRYLQSNRMIRSRWIPRSTTTSDFYGTAIAEELEKGITNIGDRYVCPRHGTRNCVLADPLPNNPVVLVHYLKIIGVDVLNSNSTYKNGPVSSLISEIDPIKEQLFACDHGSGVQGTHVSNTGIYITPAEADLIRTNCAAVYDSKGTVSFLCPCCLLAKRKVDRTIKSLVTDYENVQSDRHKEKDFRLYSCRTSLRSTTGFLLNSGKRKHKYYHYARPLTFGTHPQSYGKVSGQFHVMKDLDPHTIWTVGGGPLQTIRDAWGALRKIDHIYDMNKVNNIINEFRAIKEREHIGAALDLIPDSLWPAFLSAYIALRKCRRLYCNELFKAKSSDRNVIEESVRKLCLSTQDSELSWGIGWIIRCFDKLQLESIELLLGCEKDKFFTALCTGKFTVTGSDAAPFLFASCVQVLAQLPHSSVSSNIILCCGSSIVPDCFEDLMSTVPDESPYPDKVSACIRYAHEAALDPDAGLEAKFRNAATRLRQIPLYRFVRQDVLDKLQVNCPSFAHPEYKDVFPTFRIGTDKIKASLYILERIRDIVKQLDSPDDA